MTGINLSVILIHYYHHYLHYCNNPSVYIPTLKFGEYQGKKALIRLALYGGESAGRDCWLHLQSCMEYLRFSPCKTEADIWMKKTKGADNTDYWEYVLLYVDDCLCILVDPELFIREDIEKYFLMKEASIGEPDVYLGGKVRKVELETRELCWAFNLS